MLKKSEALKLRGLGLEDIPAELSWGVPPFEKMWVSLIEIDLSQNALFKTDEVFASIACLGPHLKILDLTGNSLAGVIPDCAGELAALEILKISKNQLTGISEKAANGWIHLKNLIMNRNALLTLPHSSSIWGNSLMLLDLRCNLLTQIDDESCHTWNKIKTIQLGSNKLTQLPLSIKNWINLIGLYITDNKITSLPLELRNCQRLEILHAGVNLLKDLPPELFGGGSFQFMRDVELYRNKIVTCPEELGSDMPSLQQLSLSGNAIKSIPVGIGKCSSLRELHFANVAKLGKV